MLILLFDIDGTLINTGGAGGAALNQAFRDEFQVDEPAAVPFAGRTDRGIGSDLFRAHDIDDTQANWLRLRQGYLERLPHYLTQREGRVLAGVKELLRRLTQQEQVTVGLLTGNTADGARIKLTYYGLFEQFSFGGFGDDHQHRDQVAEAAWAEARRHLGPQFDAARAWVIGDTPLDVACARAIGAAALAVATGGHSSDELAEAQPDLLLEDLTNTDQVLAALR